VSLPPLTADAALVGGRASAYFDEVFARVTAAHRRIGWAERRFRIAGRSVDIRATGPAIAAALTRAFAHLAAASPDEPALTVYLADKDAVDLPACPWNLPTAPAVSSEPGAGPVTHVRDERIDALWSVDGASLSMIDHAARTAVFWTRSPERVPYYDRAAPLRAILDWWGRHHGWHVLHAGAIGTERGGVLVIGKAGSGKSTTVLACLGAGFLYAGDDGVAVTVSPVPFAHSLYCTAKLEPGHLTMALPQLTALLAGSEQTYLGKRMFFLDRDPSSELSAGFPLRAVLLPRVTGAGRASARRASSVEGLLALAPSTLFQLPGARPERLRHMAELFQRVPAHVLELGRDLTTVAPIIRSILDGAAR
jgi:hypothetical protein